MNLIEKLLKEMDKNRLVNFTLLFHWKDMKAEKSALLDVHHVSGRIPIHMMFANGFDDDVYPGHWLWCSEEEVIQFLEKIEKKLLAKLQELQEVKKKVKISQVPSFTVTAGDEEL